MKRGFESIPKDLISRGKVEKKEIIKRSSFELAILRLAPQSRVTFHQHILDREIYIGWKVFNYCTKGEWHGLRNWSLKNKYIISIKFK